MASLAKSPLFRLTAIQFQSWIRFPSLSFLLVQRRDRKVIVRMSFNFIDQVKHWLSHSFFYLLFALMQKEERLPVMNILFFLAFLFP